jgi:hypothetical protein
VIANHVAHGSSADNVHGYLKAVSKTGWQLVNWLSAIINYDPVPGIPIRYPQL